MKIFVINLKKNTDRMQKVAAQLQRMNLCFERFEAIYGKEMSEEEKHACVNSFRWWCIKGYEIRDGEIGCTCSHNKIYEKILKEALPYCCILEDDVVLNDLFSKQLANVEAFLAANLGKPIVVQLNNSIGSDREDWAIGRIENSSRSEAYVINRMAAEAYLKANSPMCAPVDLWGYWQKKGIFELYQAYPPVCKQDWSPGFTTDVCPVGSFDASRLSLFGKLFWAAKRFIGKSLDRILF